MSDVRLGSLVFAVTSAVTTVYVLVASALFSYQLSASGIAAAAAACIATAYGVHVYVKFVHGQQIFRLNSLLAPMAFICLLTGFLPFSFAELLVSQPERFHIERSSILSTPLKNPGRSPWISVHEIPTLRLSQIHFMIWMQIENEQQQRATIEAYSFSTSRRPGGPWKELCPVSLSGSRLYFSVDRRAAIENSTANFLDNLLLEKPLLPLQPVSGWTAWECLGDCTGQFGKFTVRDTSGHRISAIFSLANTSEREANSGVPLDVIRGSKRDLSLAEEGLEPDCSQ